MGGFIGFRTTETLKMNSMMLAVTQMVEFLLLIDIKCFLSHYQTIVIKSQVKPS